MLTIPTLPPDAWIVILSFGGSLDLCPYVHIKKRDVAILRIQRFVRGTFVPTSLLLSGQLVRIALHSGARLNGIVVKTNYCTAVEVLKPYAVRQYFFLPHPSLRIHCVSRLS